MPSRFTRREIWRHNGLLGSTRFAMNAVANVLSARTTTKEAKATAAKIDTLLRQLLSELKTRDE